MSGVRRRHSAAFKGKVALEALKEAGTMAQLSGEYGVHANQISQWKKKLKEGIPGIFANGKKKKQKEAEELQCELYRKIGQLQLQVELDWLKKKVRTFLTSRKGG